VSDQLLAPAALTTEKIPKYPLDGRLNGSQSLLERRGYKEVLVSTANGIQTFRLVRLAAYHCTAKNVKLSP
jgi:hypothetical protein